MDVGDAYAIQQVNLARRLARGRKLVGHKIGLTSEPMQTLLGVDEPDFGYILDEMVLPDGSAVPRDMFCAPRVEPEVAFLLNRAAAGPNVTVQDVRAATGGGRRSPGDRGQPHPRLEAHFVRHGRRQCQFWSGRDRRLAAYTSGDRPRRRPSIAVAQRK